MRELRSRRQEGQGLLLVLVFLAAFLLITWAGLRLASQSFLATNSVEADTRATYALDGGIAQGIAAARWIGPFGCFTFTLPSFTATYPSDNATVTTTISPAPGCSAANPDYDLAVNASNTSRTARAEIYASGGTWVIRWQAYQ